jgi:hypothetical protein
MNVRDEMRSTASARSEAGTWSLTDAVRLLAMV